MYLPSTLHSATGGLTILYAIAELNFLPRDHRKFRFSDSSISRINDVSSTINLRRTRKRTVIFCYRTKRWQNWTSSLRSDFACWVQKPTVASLKALLCFRKTAHGIYPRALTNVQLHQPMKPRRHPSGCLNGLVRNTNSLPSSPGTKSSALEQTGLISSTYFLSEAKPTRVQQVVQATSLSPWHKMRFQANLFDEKWGWKQ